MGNLLPTSIDDWLAHPAVHVRPRVFLELGTFEGKTAAMAADRFPIVHTVELSEVYCHKAMAAYSDRVNIHFHQGNSRKWLFALAAEIRGPMLVYHDAHWWSYPGVAKDFPLWDDLEILSERRYADIIVVDEVHRFGDVGPTPDWKSVSLERIAGFFPGHRAAVIIGNQAVVYRGAP